MILSPTPLRTQIELTGTIGRVLYNALLNTGASHNQLSFNAWNQLGRLALTQSNFKVNGVNGQPSYVLGVLCQQLFIVLMATCKDLFCVNAYRRTL